MARPSVSAEHKQIIFKVVFTLVKEIFAIDSIYIYIELDAK